MNVPHNIPRQVIQKAECVIVFPSVLKAAFGIGASYGRGAMVCRTGKDFRGPWGAPAMYALEGGSVGFQIGGQATDLVLLIMNGRETTAIAIAAVKAPREMDRRKAVLPLIDRLNIWNHETASWVIDEAFCGSFVPSL